MVIDIRRVLDPTQNQTPTQALSNFYELISKWEKKYPSLKSYKNNHTISYFTYFNYQIEVRRMIYTTNWIERLNRNYKRVLRMRSSMPSPESVLFLLGSVSMKRKEFNHPILAFSYDKNLFP